MSDPILNVTRADGDSTLALAPDHPVTVGRHPRNSLCLDEQGVSRFHCVIHRVGQAVYVVDLQSRNGTLVNGSPVKAAQFRPGDVMEIGLTRITLTHSPDGAPPRPMPLPPLGPRPQPSSAQDQRDTLGLPTDYNPSSSVAGSGGYSPSPSLDQTLNSGSSHNSM